MKRLLIIAALLVLAVAARADTGMMMGMTGAGVIKLPGFILLETGAFLLLESGGKICLEGNSGC